jgi:DNA-binding MarR family transcriptional regulator
VINEHSKLAERETGLTGSQLWAMKVIGEDTHIKPSELARRMYLHPATVVGLIDRLARKGLVIRTRPEKDRRTVEISLTELGKELLLAAPEVPQGLLVRGLENLTMDKLSKIATGTEELVRMLGAEGVPPQLILSTEVNMPARRRK